MAEMFSGVTGASFEVAQGYLSLTGEDVERAIELYFENPDLASNFASTPVVPTHSSRAGRQDASGVIHIDSDNEDEDMLDDAARQAAALAQEEEDAAMAKRLQEELYGADGSGSGSAGPMGDEVRAPIARTTETLVDQNMIWGGIEDDDGAQNAAVLAELRRRQQRPGPPRSGGPFGQHIWGDSAAQTDSTTEGAANGSHARRLADLFRPPYDMMQRRITWDEARSLGKEDKKWIMVNLQDMNDFNCQALNRDIWKDDAVKALVSENFLFLQYDKDFPDAEEYLTFYFPNQSHENPDNYPHVSIIDPRTGEQVKIWSGRPFPSAPEFHAEVAEFLDRYSLAANSKNPVAKATARPARPVDVERMTEDEMLEMALKNSLAGAESSSTSSSTPNVVDPDALTKVEESEVKGKELEPASPFSLISSTTPHTEPANDPATTTRIQFRHPTGRVIRRFNVNDSIRRVYEWLKAEPLEGKEGITFELKKMPQGQDLIDEVDVSISEAGLKQGTVMIEFIED